jgi:hypothetical protein
MIRLLPFNKKTSQTDFLKINVLGNDHVKILVIDLRKMSCGPK